MNAHQTNLETLASLAHKELLLPLEEFIMFKDYPEYIKERCMFPDELLELYSEDLDLF